MKPATTFVLRATEAGNAANQPEAIWYRPSREQTVRASKYLNPSDKADETKSRVVAQHTIHEGIALTGGYDSAEAGTCIHDYFAVHGTPGFVNLSVAERLIDNFNLSVNIQIPEQLPASAEALLDWFRNNASDVSAIHRELPFSHKLKSGQVVNGRIDLMVEMKDRHCLLVDYKTARTEKEYAPQMTRLKCFFTRGRWKQTGLLWTTATSSTRFQDSWMKLSSRRRKVYELLQYRPFHQGTLSSILFS